MSEQLLLINPRRRKRRRSRARRKNPRKRRMPAALRRYWATHRRGRSRRRLSNPRRRRHSARRHRHHNPRRKYRRLRNPRFHMRRRRRHHRNPIASVNSAVHNAIIPGAIGAGGALALDFAMGFITPSLPAQFQTGIINAGVQMAGAIGLGVVGKKFLGEQRGNYVMLGGLVVVLYNLIKPMLTGSGINLPGLSGYSDYTPYKLGGMGAYLRGTGGTAGFKGLGYVSPAAVVGPTMSPRMSGLGAYMQRPMNVAPVDGNWGDGM